MIFFAVSADIYADTYEYDGDCRSEGRNERFEDCLDRELSEYDKELNELYKEELKNNKKLQRIEMIWIAFKDADCRYMSLEVHGGLYCQYIYKACLINKTKARISDLKRSYRYGGWFEKKM